MKNHVTPNPAILTGGIQLVGPSSSGSNGDGMTTDGNGNLAFVPLARTDQAVTFSGNVNTTGQFQVNGSQISTDDVTEGSNQYFTDERVDDRVNQLLSSGTGISLSYDDNANSLTITNTGTSSGDATFSGVEATRDTTLSVSNNTATIIDWDGELFDTDTYHDSGTNPSRLTVPNAGKYLIGGTIEFAAWSTLSDGRLQVRLFKNGSFIRELIDNEVDSSGGDGPSYSFQTIVDAAASDYFELNVLQVSGGSRDLTTNSVFYAARMQGSGPSQLADLNDVDSINYTAGRVLRADGSQYVTAQLNTSDLNNDANYFDTAGTGLSQSGSTVSADFATATETTTGTESAKAVTPDGLAGSDFGKRFRSILIESSGNSLSTGDGLNGNFISIPPELNGFNLVAVHAQVATAGSGGGTTDIQVHNVTDAVDMLSTPLTIDSGEKSSHTAATEEVVDTNNDDVATGDELRIDLDAVSSTPPQGLSVDLIFQLP